MNSITAQVSERGSIELQGNCSYIKVGMSGMIPQVLMESYLVNERKEMLWSFPGNIV